jgi:ribose/xylose/arabinose/galactoside ABC-type transport system permease subunit
MMRRFNWRLILMSYGFAIVFVLVVLFFSAATRNFLSVSNILTVLANAAPWLVMATGLALVIMTASIDISIGSILFLALASVNMLMLNRGLPVAVGIPMILLIGSLMGAVNGVLIVLVGINPLITTMGMMFALRGFTLWLTDARVQDIPPALQEFGKTPYFKEFIILTAAVILVLMHLLVTRTTFGRHVMAIGNSAEIAARLGVRVKRVSFITYVMSGLMVCAGGILQIMQLSNIHPRLGQGYEFIAIAACVVGGISLFGGEGSIIPGLVMGGLTLVIVENGLTHLGVSPYAYPFVRGGIIFIAMYADAMKSRVLARVHVAEDREAEPAPG